VTETGAGEPEAPFYLLWLRAGGRDHYLLWHSGEQDLVAVHKGAVLHFDDPEQARHVATRRGLTLSEEEPLLHDTDAAAAWVRGEAEFDPDQLLEIWNAADDVLRSLGLPELKITRADRNLYGKLFRSADIPVPAPYRPKAPPVWRPSQIERLRGYISRGVQALQECAERQNPVT
jgi:hypothetical protein